MLRVEGVNRPRRPQQIVAARRLQGGSIKRFGGYVAMFAITIAGMFVAGEVVLRLFSPVEYLSPRYKYSPKYGFLLFEDTRMVHARPGDYKFHYTVNSYGYRGEAVELATSYDLPNIVVLGDSYAFGMGTNDGEQFAAVMGRELAGRYRVVNLGNPGWGLTQQIRRYYDLGMLYHPEIVVLQFCSNDPEDNFNNMVTRLVDGEFEFVDSESSVNWVKKYLSRSFLQKTQVYNFFRNRAYLLVKNAAVAKKEEQYSGTSDGASPREDLYSRLIEAFARKLHDDGVLLVMIAVNGQLDRFPHIRATVEDLDRAGTLNYIEVREWFEGESDFGSPEGHVWGTKAHAIIGAALADSIIVLAD